MSNNQAKQDAVKTAIDALNGAMKSLNWTIQGNSDEINRRQKLVDKANINLKFIYKWCNPEEEGPAERISAIAEHRDSIKSGLTLLADQQANLKRSRQELQNIINKLKGE